MNDENFVLDEQKAYDLLGFGDKAGRRYSLGAIERAMKETNVSWLTRVFWKCHILPNPGHTVALDSVRKTLADFERSRLFFNKAMVEGPKEEIAGYLKFLRAGEAVLDETGESTAEDIKARIDQARCRAHFIVDCRKIVGKDLKENRFDFRMKDHIVRKTVDLVGETGDGFGDVPDSSNEKELFVKKNARIASKSYAVERLGDLEERVASFGPETIIDEVQKIRAHLYYAATNVVPQSEKLPLSIDDGVRGRIDFLECRAIFIGTYEIICCDAADLDEVGTSDSQIADDFWEIKIGAREEAAILWDDINRNHRDSIPSDPKEFSSDVVEGLIRKVEPVSLGSPVPV